MADNQTKNKLRLRIVTPSRQLYEEDVEMVIFRSITGDMGVLYGHEPTTTVLSYGVARVFNGDNEEYFAVLGGFAEITEKSVTILSDAAERPEEIDKERAMAAKERAERRLANLDSSIEQRRAELALRRALVRIETSSYTLIKK